MDFEDPRSMQLTFDGYGRSINFTLNDDEADCLDTVMAKFADFLRAVSFVYVGVQKNTDGSYTFHRDYKWSDATPTDMQDVINDAAQSYWDGYPDNFEVCSTVVYTGRGKPDKDHKHPHAGNSGVSMIGKRGTIVSYNADPLPRYLVRWTDWHDGHNGMGADPEATVGSKSYWWVSPENMSAA